MNPQEFLDDIKYGNASQESMYWTAANTYLDTHFTQLTTFSHPANSSTRTSDELTVICNYISQVAKNPDLLSRCLEIDRKGFRFYKELIEQSEMITEKEDFAKMIDEIITDASPLIHKLKHFFSRPRPSQIGYYYKYMLFPYRSVSSDCGSFPSASVYFARIFTEVIGNRKPELYASMRQLHKEVCDSRLALGLNYPSDIEAANYAADLVISTPEFKVKYKL